VKIAELYRPEKENEFSVNIYGKLDVRYNCIVQHVMMTLSAPSVADLTGMYRVAQKSKPQKENYSEMRLDFLFRNVRCESRTISYHLVLNILCVT